ncbi:VWA domain-containing protein, partial [bacterium]
MKRLLVLLAASSMILGLSACATATATQAPQPIAEEPRYATSAPMPTAAPEYLPPENYAAPTIAVPAPNNGMDNYFQDYGVNPFTSSERDHLSTFGLDVDTASYEITRSYIRDGALPPMDAVRAEEFINAFDQGYAAPQDAAFTLYADGGPSPFVQPGNVLLRFGVQGYRVSDFERKPFNLTFVIDASGSMGQDNRLGLVQDSLRLLVDRLDERDTITIVAYSEDAWLVLQPTNASDRRTIQRAINQLYPTNTTNLDAGLRLGYQYAYRTLNPNAVNRVILCSDGVANQGNIDANPILDYVQGYVDSGITLTGIGVGMGNYNDVLLEQLADRGDGNYYYVDTSEQAREVFVENLTATMQVIA